MQSPNKPSKYKIPSPNKPSKYKILSPNKHQNIKYHHQINLQNTITKQTSKNTITKRSPTNTNTKQILKVITKQSNNNQLITSK